MSRIHDVATALINIYRYIVPMPIHTYPFCFYCHGHVVARCRRIDASVTDGTFMVAEQGAGRQTTRHRKQTSHICTRLAQAMLRGSQAQCQKAHARDETPCGWLHCGPTGQDHAQGSLETIGTSVEDDIDGKRSSSPCLFRTALSRPCFA